MPAAENRDPVVCGKAERKEAWRELAMDTTAGRKSNFAKAVPSILVTGFATILLLVFLIPFIYMVMTSLKTQAQFTRRSGRSGLRPIRLRRIYAARSP
jgi:ABC-type glycerol-3-phosphate transport system permease component